MSNGENAASVRLEDGVAAARIVLVGSVGAYHSDELYYVCLSAVEAGKHVEVDCREVTHLGASTVQLLLALSRALDGHGRHLAVRGAPPPVHALLHTAGAADLLPPGAL